MAIARAGRGRQARGRADRPAMGRCQGRDRRDQGRARRRRRLRDAGRAAQRRPVQGPEGPAGLGRAHRRPVRRLLQGGWQGRGGRRGRPDQERRRLVPAEGRRPPGGGPRHGPGRLPRRDAGVTDEEYRDYIRQEVLRGDFQQYFKDSVITRYQPQREVAQIFLNADQGQPVPKLRVRHLLVQPIPGEQDQSARDRRAVARRPAGGREAAPGGGEAEGRPVVGAGQAERRHRAARAGRVPGLVRPAHPGAAVRARVRDRRQRPATSARSASWSASEFGYHVIQVTERRISALEQAERLAAQLQDDPDSFADVAEAESEDASSAQEGGELGWVIHYQYDAARDEAIFGHDRARRDLGPGGDGARASTSTSCSTPPTSGSCRSSSADQVGTSGFNRWLDEMRDEAGVWVDSEFNVASAGAAG